MYPLKASFAVKFWGMIWKKINLLFVLIISASFGVFATSGSSMLEPPDKLPKTTDTISFNVTANVQSRHIWRGDLTCSAWNIQPTINYSKRKFLVGAWGAYTVDNSYSEVDLYISYSVGRFTLSILDYFCPDETQKTNRFFDLDQRTTQHTIDAVLSYNGDKKLPLNIMVSTLIWGDDIDLATGKNYFSTYIEAGYTWSRINNLQFDFFAGVTPFKSYYANSFNLVNLGFTLNHKVKFNEYFSLPIFSKFILNPYTENVFFVFGFTIGN